MEAAGENAPKAAKKKTTKARMDKAEEDAINASKLQLSWVKTKKLNIL